VSQPLRFVSNTRKAFLHAAEHYDHKRYKKNPNLLFLLYNVITLQMRSGDREKHLMLKVFASE
jgi:hypothetical protein